MLPAVFCNRRGFEHQVQHPEIVEKFFSKVLKFSWIFRFGGRCILKNPNLSTGHYPIMGQKCGLAIGRPTRQLSPPNLDLRHIQDHFGFTFPRVALSRFSEGFSIPVFEPSVDTGRFFPLPVISCPCSNMGQAVFPTPEWKPGSTLRCRDYTIAFRNCKSFLPKSNCRRTASIDPTRRQLIK